MKRLFLAAAVLLFPVLSLDAQTPDTLAVSPVDTTVTADSLTVLLSFYVLRRFGPKKEAVS